MDLVQCIGFDKAKLTSDQVSKLTAFVEAHPAGDLLALRVYPNLDTTSEEDIPSGMVAIFAPSAKVDPTSIGDNMFQMFAVSRAYPPKGVAQLTEGYFESRQENLQGAVDQYSPTPISGALRHQVTNKETDVWAPEISGDGSFVGPFFMVQDDHRTKDFFIAARATVPLLVRDLKRDIAAAAAAAAEPPTYMDLLIDDNWMRKVKSAAYASKRNTFRIIANAAEAFGVNVTRCDDDAAKLHTPNHAPPEMAVPEWEQRTHGISHTSFNGKPAVMLAYGIVPADECLLLEDKRFFVVSNPYDNISVFDLSNHVQVEAAGGVPADTGRTGKSVSIGKKANQGLVWDGAGDLQAHSYKPVGGEFKEAMKTMGWRAEDHVKTLVRIAAKVNNPQLKRK